MTLKYQNSSNCKLEVSSKHFAEHVLLHDSNVELTQDWFFAA